MARLGADRQSVPANQYGRQRLVVVYPDVDPGGQYRGFRRHLDQYRPRLQQVGSLGYIHAHPVPEYYYHGLSCIQQFAAPADTAVRTGTGPQAAGKCYLITNLGILKGRRHSAGGFF